MTWVDTDLPWIMPSPSIELPSLAIAVCLYVSIDIDCDADMPTIDTAILYPGACMFEGTNLSEGRGTTRPFEVRHSLRSISHSKCRQTLNPQKTATRRHIHQRNLVNNNAIPQHPQYKLPLRLLFAHNLQVRRRYTLWPPNLHLSLIRRGLHWFRCCLCWLIAFAYSL